jgi:hypothetical protein
MPLYCVRFDASDWFGFFTVTLEAPTEDAACEIAAERHIRMDGEYNCTVWLVLKPDLRMKRCVEVTRKIKVLLDVPRPPDQDDVHQARQDDLAMERRAE